MSSTLSSTLSSVEVSTTRLIHKNVTSHSSERLVFRPLLESDFEAYHLTLKQPEPMIAYGLDALPEPRIARMWFDQFQTETRVGIFLKNPDVIEGELIGEGMVYKVYNEWPRVHYVFKKEYWVKGYATEYLNAFLPAWWDLPREKTRIFVEKISLDSHEKENATERLCAEIDKDNKGSLRVVEKTGYVLRGEIIKDHGKIFVFWRIIATKNQCFLSKGN